MSGRKIISDIKTEDYWFHWIRKYGNPHKHKQRVFGGILRDIHFEITKLIVNEQFIYKLPFNLGRLSIRKFKKKLKINDDGTINTSNLRIDWGKTNAHWAKEYPGKTKEEIREIKDKKFFYHLNKHSKGYTYRFYWNKFGTNVHNMRSYKMYPSTPLLTYMSKRILEDPSLEFYEY